MANSTAKRLQSKPKKPFLDFPFFPHATKHWAKKIRGKFHYFGPWDDPDAALQKYLEQKGELHAGRTPRVTGNGLTVADPCHRFLTAKRYLLDTRELANRSFRDYPRFLPKLSSESRCGTASRSRSRRRKRCVRSKCMKHCPRKKNPSV